MKEVENRLEKFAKKNIIRGKGALSVVLVVTRAAIKNGLPIDSKELVTERKGQVKGLGMGAVQKILKEYGITRTLAKEGGRTSRGSIENMQKYVSFLNEIHEEGIADLKVIEQWWIDEVLKYFSGKPFKLRLDPSKSVRSIVRDLLDQARNRQKEAQGTMFVGAVMQHLVGAKLDLALPSLTVEHNGFSVADAPTDRKGDFLIGDVAIHVTTTPTETLIKKCSTNISSGLRPIIVTTGMGTASAENLALALNIEGRIDIFEIEQFLALNLYEISKFAQSEQKITIEQMIGKYNKIVDACETDPSLKIKI